MPSNRTGGGSSFGVLNLADKYPWEMLKGSDWEALFAKLPRLAGHRR
jgi:hypothetical protein